MRPRSGFRFRQFTVHDDQCQMKVGTDGVLLGVWVNVAGCRNILDIGTGSGVIALILAQRTDSLVRIDAVEASHPDAAQAKLNVGSSPWHERIAIHEGIIQEFASRVRYDLIVSNPPFFSASLLPPSVQRANARHTITLTHEDILQSATRLLTDNGTLAVILPTAEGDMFLKNAHNFGLYVARSLAFNTRPEKKQERWLFELKRGPQQAREERLTLYNAMGEWSAGYQKLVGDFYL